MKTERPTPRQLGYRMPAEWEPHAATWLAWPHNRETWPEELAAVERIWEEMIRCLASQELVRLLVNDAFTEATVVERLKGSGIPVERVVTYKIPTEDTWIRDYGPTFLVKKEGVGGLAFADWIFNAWGGKYEPYLHDDQVAKDIAAILNIPVFEAGFVLEGGSIDVNGTGLCLTTEQCLLNRNRNPGLTGMDIEKLLGEFLGIDRVLWLAGGIAGDDTDGHIDDVARFVSPDTVVCVLAEDHNDEDYAVLKENYDRLVAAKELNGKKFRVVPLPTPGKVMREKTRLPASYANFYIANGVVLVPTYDHPNDPVALKILEEVFPKRKIVGINCGPLVLGLGAIHCVTQQEPAIF